MMRTTDPYGGFRFTVELDNTELGGFDHVSGMSRETKTESFREGGTNGYLHKLASGTEFTNLVLKNGQVDRAELWQWHQEVIDGNVTRKTIAVVLHDAAGREARRWVFTGAYP